MAVSDGKAVCVTVGVALATLVFVTVGVWVGVPVCVRVGVCVAVPVCVAVFVWVPVGELVAVAVGDGVFVGVLVGSPVLVIVGVAVMVPVGVKVPVLVGVPVIVRVAVGVGVSVVVGVLVIVPVAAGVLVAVLVRVGVKVVVGLDVPLAVGVGPSTVMLPVLVLHGTIPLAVSNLHPFGGGFTLPEQAASENCCMLVPGLSPRKTIDSKFAGPLSTVNVHAILTHTDPVELLRFVITRQSDGKSDRTGVQMSGDTQFALLWQLCPLVGPLPKHVLPI